MYYGKQYLQCSSFVLICQEHQTGDILANSASTRKTLYIFFQWFADYRSWSEKPLCGTPNATKHEVGEKMSQEGGAFNSEATWSVCSTWLLVGNCVGDWGKAARCAQVKPGFILLEQQEQSHLEVRVCCQQWHAQEKQIQKWSGKIRHVNLPGILADLIFLQLQSNCTNKKFKNVVSSAGIVTFHITF